MLVQIVRITLILIFCASPSVVASSDVKHDSQDSFFAVAVRASFPMYLVISLSRFLKGPIRDFKTFFTTNLNWFLFFGFVYVLCTFMVWPNVPDGDKTWQFIVPFILASVFQILYLAFSSYVPIEISREFEDTPSIGEVWANSNSKYYLETLKDFQQRMEKFEIEHKKLENGGFALKLKKMIILIPLSCDAKGTLEEKYNHFSYIDILDIHRCTQGANINREYKNPIYKVTSMDGNPSRDLYVSVEEPNTLMAFWNIHEFSQKVWTQEVWEFQRDEFISTLRYRLKDEKCVILPYDDLKDGHVMPLSEFVIEEVDKLLQAEEAKYSCSKKI